MLEGRDHEAAAVAARLKAFHADPALLAPCYRQGIEPLPEGGFVLRFAQGRFPAAMSLAPGEADAIRRAADEFVRLVCLWDRADPYQVLCVPRDAAYDAIKENYHLLMALLHPDRQRAGAEGAWPDSCAQRVNLAYATLGDESARREYDARLGTEGTRLHAAASAAPRRTRRQANEVRFAKTLFAVSAVVAILVVVALGAEDDEWGDRTVLQASLARLRASPVAGADRPRYVGATAMAPAQRASDAVAEDFEPFASLKPLMRLLVAEETKPWAPVPKVDALPARATAPVLSPAPESSASSIAARPGALAAEVPLSLKTAQASSARASAASLAPRPASDAARPTNLEIESLVVALIGYYEAGDADRLVGLVDGGFWRTAQMKHAYADFFGATRARRLRLERLAWNMQSGAAKARGEATVVAEYFDRTAPVERRVDVELDIGLRDGQARITRLSLFPESR